MKRLQVITYVLIAVSAVSSCGGGGGQASVPRPAAWPRVEMPDSAYSTIEADGVSLTVNRGVESEVKPTDDGAWVTLTYDAFGSPKMFLTLTRCDDMRIADVIANRNERMKLNIGDSSAVLTELTTPSGWIASMMVARGVTTTPVQILAHDGRRVLSGSLVLSLPDSLSNVPEVAAPVVDAVERDMLVMLKGLGK